MLPLKRETMDMASSRFSVNSNLMNYSIPRPQEPFDEAITLSANPPRGSSLYKRTSITDDGSTKREIQSGDVDTRTRQLKAQIEQLTLQNVKLQRTNRLLKVDTDNLIKQKTDPLEKTIQELTVANVKLQRTTRLLQQELEEKTKELNTVKQDQILKMKSVGPEYEFLVQNINLLQRQIAGQPICEDTCCFTMQPIDQSTMVMTLPSAYSSSSSSLCSSSSEGDEVDGEEDELAQSEGVEAQHICRPVIHSTVSQGSYATELEKKIIGLQQIIEGLDSEKEQILKQQSYKDSDIETLKRELRIKDEIVSQLEQDFMGLEDQLEQLQKELQDQSLFSPPSPSTCRPHSDSSTVSTAPTMVAIDDSKYLQSPSANYAYLVQNDPRRQSQLLMESKRKSLAIKDINLLEEMLKDDLEKYDGRPLSLDSFQRASFISAASSFSSAKDVASDANTSEQEQQKQQSSNDLAVRSASPQSTVIDGEDSSSLSHATIHSSNNGSSGDTLKRKGSIVRKENTTTSASMSIPPADTLCLSCVGFPCAYLCCCSSALSTTFSTTVPEKHSSHQSLVNSKRQIDAFTQFACLAVVMGVVSSLGVTEDWTVPFALAIMVSAPLYQRPEYRSDNSLEHNIWN